MSEYNVSLHRREPCPSHLRELLQRLADYYVAMRGVPSDQWEGIPVSAEEFALLKDHGFVMDVKGDEAVVDFGKVVAAVSDYEPGGVDDEDD